ncbi:unnamed protein product [Symbiodinium sp. CCMP2592]|nr:unnamed protein product [Symbiodinium sp. CCMP2592]
MADVSAATCEVLFEEPLGRYVLREVRSEEVKVLDAGVWRLAQTEAGDAYVANGEKTLWCEELLDITVLQHPTKQEDWVCLPDGTDMGLKEFRCRHHRIEVPLRVVGCATEMSLPCLLLKQSVDGCRLLWSLTHLHRLVLGKAEKMTPSRWLHSWWQWWLKLVTRFHMGPGHLRKAAGQDADDSEVYRIFEVPVVSTAMLLLLSARFAADSRGSQKKNQQSKDGWSSALAALLAKYVPENDHEISIFLDTSVVLRMGIHCRGRHLVGLPVQNGLVDLSAVFSCQDAAVGKRLAVFGQAPPRKLTLADALVWLTNGGKQVQWLLSQFIHRLACTIEHAIQEQFSRSSATPGLAATTPSGQEEEAEQIAAGREQRQQQARLRKAQTGIKPMQPMPLHKVLLKYFYAMRKKMATSRVLHVAFDASRVGGLSSLLGFVTNGAGGAAWLPPQVVPDLVTRTTLALAHQDEEALERERTEYAKLAEEFFHSAEKSEKTVATGAGWKQFRASGSPETWRSITISLDQGSDGWSAAHFLCSEKVNAFIIGDVSHRTWNDCQLALHDVKLNWLVLSVICLLNSDSGPWNSERWWQSLKQSADEYVQVASHNKDPLYLAYEAAIVEEQTSGDEMAEGTADPEQLFNSIPDAFDHKQQKVGKSRWFQVAVALRHFLPLRAKRLVVSLYLCLSLCLFKSGRAADLLKLPSVTLAATQDVPKTNTATDAEDVRELRKQCQNTLSIKVTIPGQRALEIQHLKTESIVVELEDDLCHALGSLAVSVAGRRLRTLSELQGYPYKFPALLGPAASQVLQQMRRDWQPWQSIQDLKGAFWERMRKRSFFNQLKVLQIFQLAANAEWKMTETLAQLIRQDWSGITQTKLIEDGVREGRVAEMNPGFNKRVKPERLYENLINGDVACKKHRFSTLEYDTVTLPRGLASKSGKGLFHSAPGKIPKEYKKVCSEKQQADYHSPAPIMGTMPTEDLILVRWCQERKQLHLARCCFFALLVVPMKMLIRHKSYEGGAWFLAVRNYTGMSVMALKLQAVQHSGHSFFACETVTRPHFLPIVETESWQCCSFAFRSPLFVRLATGAWCVSQGSLIQATSQPTSLLKLAAQNSFWTLPKTALATIGKEVGVQLDKSRPLAELILCFAESILGALSDEEKLRLLRLRLPKKGDVEEWLLQQEDLGDLLEKDDAEELQKERDAHNTAKEEFGHSVRQLASKVRHARKASQSSRKSSSAREEPADKRRRRYPNKVLAICEQSSIDSLNSLVPSTCRFGVDRIDYCWRLSAYGTRYGRSWQLYGVEGAAKQLLKIAWQLAVEAGHEESCPFPELEVQVAR